MVVTQGLREEFESQQDGWKAVYDSTDPEQETFPGRWEKELQGIRALCILRYLVRPVYRLG